MRNSLPFRTLTAAGMLLLALCLYTGELYAQINNLDDVPATQWNGQTSNGASFAAANDATSTDGQAIRFDLGCGAPPCSFGAAHTWDPSIAADANTDAATSITEDFMAMMDSSGNTNSQAVQFGIDQAFCTANCGTASASYSLFRYALQCDFKGSGLWRVWDANTGWVATSHGCAAFTPALGWNHFVFHLARPNNSQVTYVDMVINGTTYTINQTQAAQNLGSTVQHQFTPWVELDGDSATDAYSLWMDQWSIAYSGGGTGGTTIDNIDVLPGTTDQSAMNQWISCSPDCGGPNTPNPPLVSQVSTPSEDGTAALFQTDSGPQVGYSGDYWYVQHGGLTSQVNTLQYSFDLYIPSQFLADDTVWAIEFECQQTIGGQLFNFAWSDDFNDTHQWTIFNYATSTWELSGIPYTPLSGDTWHHITANFHTSGSQVIHDSITVDGVTHFPTQNNVHGAVPGADNTFNNAFQLDMNQAGNGYYVYVDNMKVTYTLQ